MQIASRNVDVNGNDVLRFLKDIGGADVTLPRVASALIREEPTCIWGETDET